MRPAKSTSVRTVGRHAVLNLHNTLYCCSCLQVPLLKSHRLAGERQRYIVFYVEKESTEASKRTIAARHAMSNAKVSTILNDQVNYI
jgi:hypothetical protein